MPVLLKLCNILISPYQKAYRNFVILVHPESRFWQTALFSWTVAF